MRRLVIGVLLTILVVGAALGLVWLREREDSMSVSAVCANNMKFAGEETIPDGSVLAAGSPQDKRWVVINTGRTTWGSDYRLIRLYGEGPEERRQILPEPAPITQLTPGKTGEVGFRFTTPRTPGHYRIWYELQSPCGRYGDILWLDFSVR